MNRLIEVTSVSKQYTGTSLVQVIENVDLSVEKGQFISLIGPSGCGKTTLLNMISGFIEPSTGTIKVEGTIVTGPRTDVSVVFQDLGLFWWKNVYQNIEFGLKAQNIHKDERRKKISKYLEITDLQEYAKSYPHKLSGGMQQRLAFARALVLEPNCLLLDEPFSSLDSITRNTLQRQLLNIWRVTNQSILMVTHSIEEAILLSDSVIVLGPRPSRVLGKVEVPWPRPRWNLVHESEFVSMSNHLNELLKNASN